MTPVDLQARCAVLDKRILHLATERAAEVRRMVLLEGQLREAMLQNEQLRASIKSVLGAASRPLVAAEADDSAKEEQKVLGDVDVVIGHLAKHKIRGGKLDELGDSVDRARRGEKASGAIGRKHPQGPGAFW